MQTKIEVGTRIATRHFHHGTIAKIVPADNPKDDEIHVWYGQGAPSVPYSDRNTGDAIKADCIVKRCDILDAW